MNTIQLNGEETNYLITSVRERIKAVNQEIEHYKLIRYERKQIGLSTDFEETLIKIMNNEISELKTLIVKLSANT